MPLYAFACDICQHSDDEYGQMKDATPVGECKICPKCSAPVYRRLTSRVNTDLQEFHTPIEMHSVACTSWDEIRQIQRECPDVKISDDPNDEMFGIPIAANRKQKLSILKATGYVERK